MPERDSPTATSQARPYETRKSSERLEEERTILLQAARRLREYDFPANKSLADGLSTIANGIVAEIVTRGDGEVINTEEVLEGRRALQVPHRSLGPWE